MAVPGGRSADKRGDALRRYPALAYLGGAVALALLLPSGLNLPNSGPSTLAEYAPVPGQGEGVGDVSEFGQATSGDGPGFGAGDGPGPTAPTTEPGTQAGATGGRTRIKAGNKKCVGNPPRQTEDPLSPPCVAFFEGDNFGATAKGVTKDEVAVVYKADSSNGSASDRRANSVIDCAANYADDDTAAETICKTYMRYFNERYQTYGRRIRFYSVHPTSTGQSDFESRLKPFAGLDIGDPKAKTVAFSYTGQLRNQYQRDAPYRVSYRPDLEDMADMAATFVCLKLKDRPARFSDNPADQTKIRKFGIASRSDQAYQGLLKQALAKSCGLTDVFVTDNQINDATVAARLRDNGVTTVLSYSGNGTELPNLTRQATRLAWFPEWVVPSDPGARGTDTNFYARLTDQAQWQNAMGVSIHLRRGVTAEQQWFKAYREGCPDCADPATLGTGASALADYTYDLFRMLFYGIQAAGPKLTPENVDKGLHAIPARASDDPFSPSAYFAPANYSFVKDAVALWWDPAGQPPGATNAGCYRLVEDGLRHRAGEWPTGDADLFDGRGVCQGEV